MNPTNSLVFTGLIVTAGTWAENKPLNIKVVGGVGMSALFLAAIGNANPRLAQQFGLLILALAALRYGVPIAEKMGVIGTISKHGRAPR